MGISLLSFQRLTCHSYVNIHTCYKRYNRPNNCISDIELVTFISADSCGAIGPVGWFEIDRCFRDHLCLYHQGLLAGPDDGTKFVP